MPSFLSHFLHPAQDVCYSSNYHLLLISTELSIYIDSVKSRQIIPALVFLLFFLPPTLYILFIKGTKYQQQTAKHFSIYSQRKEKLRTEVKKNFRTVPRLFQLFLIRTLCQRTNIKTNRKKKIICNFNSILALRPNGNLASNEGGKKIEARLKLVLRKIPIACVPPLILPFFVANFLTPSHTLAFLLRRFLAPFFHCTHYSIYQYSCSGIELE